MIVARENCLYLALLRHSVKLAVVIITRAGRLIQETGEVIASWNKSIILAVKSITLSDAAKGLKFYLIPDFSKINWNVAVAAMNQAFFSLSVGMGSMAIFG
ncbi:MAG: hypothetical protein IKS39_09690, partial [Clostridia bacterium]|nr:hypothetical protein [Clostridia bacterium]